MCIYLSQIPQESFIYQLVRLSVLWGLRRVKILHWFDVSATIHLWAAFSIRKQEYLEGCCPLDLSWLSVNRWCERLAMNVSWLPFPIILCNWRSPFVFQNCCRFLIMLWNKVLIILIFLHDSIREFFETPLLTADLVGEELFMGADRSAVIFCFHSNDNLHISNFLLSFEFGFSSLLYSTSHLGVFLLAADNSGHLFYIMTLGNTDALPWLRLQAIKHNYTR